MFSSGLTCTAVNVCVGVSLFSFFLYVDFYHPDMFLCLFQSKKKLSASFNVFTHLSNKAESGNHPHDGCHSGLKASGYVHTPSNHRPFTGRVYGIKNTYQVNVGLWLHCLQLVTPRKS